MGLAYADLQVLEVAPGSIAERIGIKKGDLILELNGQKVGSNIRIFVRNLSQLIQTRQKVQLKILRENEEKIIILDPASGPYVQDRLGMVLSSKEVETLSRGEGTQKPSSLSFDVRNIKYYVKLTKSPLTNENQNQINSINVLTGVIFYDNRVYFLGYHDPKYKTGPIDYERLLSEALSHPNPSLSIDPVEEEKRLDLIDRELSKELARISADQKYGIQKLTTIFLDSLNSPKNKDIIERKLSKYKVSIEDIKLYLSYQKGALKLHNLDEANKAYNSFYRLYNAAFTEEGYSYLAPLGITALWYFREASQLDPKNSSQYLLHALFTMNLESEYEAIRARYLQKGRLTDKDYADFAKEITALVYKTLLTHLKVSSSQINALINQAMYISLNKGYLDDTQLANFINQKELEIMKKFFLHKILEVVFIDDIKKYFNIPSIFSQVNIKNLNRNTEMFEIVFMADVSLKNIGTDVGDVDSFLEFAYKKGKLNFIERKGSVGFTIIPKEVNVYKVFNNILYLGNSDVYINVWNKKKINDKEMEILIKEYETYLNNKLDYFKQKYPYIHKVSELQKILAIARYIKDNNIRVEVNPDSQYKGISVPERLETYSYGMFFYNPQATDSSLFFNMRGGVDFSEIEKKVRVSTSDLKPHEVMERLAQTMVLSEKALASALSGDLETARHFAEQAFQAISVSQRMSKVTLPSNVSLHSIREVKIPEFAAFNAEVLRILNEILLDLAKNKKLGTRAEDTNLQKLKKLETLVKQYKEAHLYTEKPFDFAQLAVLSSSAKPALIATKPPSPIVAPSLALIEASKEKPIVNGKLKETLDKVLEWHREEIKSSVIDVLTEKTEIPLDKLDKALSVGKLVKEAGVDRVFSFLEEVKVSIADETKWEELASKSFKTVEESERELKKEAVRTVVREYLEKIPKVGGLLGKFFFAEETARDIIRETK